MVFWLVNVQFFLYTRAQIDTPAGLEAHYARNNTARSAMKIREWWMVTMDLLEQDNYYDTTPTTTPSIPSSSVGECMKILYLTIWTIFFWTRWLLRSWIFMVDLLGSMVTLACLRQSTRTCGDWVYSAIQYTVNRSGKYIPGTVWFRLRVETRTERTMM